MSTKKGIVKKTALTQYKNSNKNGLIAIKLDDDDDLIGVKFTDGTRQNGVNFGMGGDTFDWVSRSRIYIPKKPVKSIDFILSVYVSTVPSAPNTAPSAV